MQEASKIAGIAVEVEWMPYFLTSPGSLPKEGLDLKEYISKKYGRSAIEFERMTEQMRQTGLKAGIKFSSARRIVSTMDCHRLMVWTNQTYGSVMGDRLMEEMFKSYFEHADNVSEKNVILNCVQRVAGIDLTEAAEVLNDSSRFEREVISQDAQVKSSLGVRGVPYFIIQMPAPLKPIAFSGAQVGQNFTSCFIL